jgi:hypothetical protein
MPSYGNTYCTVCELPLLPCAMPIPGFGRAPDDEGADWLYDTRALARDDSDFGIMPYHNLQGCWQKYKDGDAGSGSEGEIASSAYDDDDDKLTGYKTSTMSAYDGTWLPVHAKCLAAARKAIGSTCFDTLKDMEKGLWARYQEQFFIWSSTQGIEHAICNEEAMDIIIQSRLDRHRLREERRMRSEP